MLYRLRLDKVFGPRWIVWQHPVLGGLGFSTEGAVDFIARQLKENDMTKKPAKLVKSLSQTELQYAGELLNQAAKEDPTHLKVDVKINGTAAAQVMKRLINERLDRMTFLELALTLAHVMEKK